MSPKLIVSLFLGVAGVSVATATTALSTNLFSSQEKCWYDDEKAGDFLEKVEKIIKQYPEDEKTFPNNKKISDLKDLIKSLCSKDPKDLINRFDEEFGERSGNQLLNEVFDLLMKKWLKINELENQLKIDRNQA